MRLILASASPRRLQLLGQIGIIPDAIIPANIDETERNKELPTIYAKRMALEKAQIIAKTEKDCFILAADTVVTVGRRILPKTNDINTAKECLNLLSGRRHQVIGGLTIIDPNRKSVTKLIKTTVNFKRLSSNEINNYLNSKEWHGKAGGYAIQGLAACFVKSINGSYSNIVGLSLYDTKQTLLGLGYKNV